jgi:hypothetical protein
MIVGREAVEAGGIEMILQGGGFATEDGVVADYWEFTPTVLVR